MGGAPPSSSGPAIAGEKRGRFPALDGLRGWACVIVLINHAAVYGIIPHSIEALVYGRVAVVLFFVLSGFMMMYHYYTKAQLSVRYWLAFLVRRFMRIYPPFAVAVTIYSLFPRRTGLHWHYLSRYLAADGIIAQHFWTIPPEMAFYTFFPLLSLGLFLLPLNAYGKLAVLAGGLAAYVIPHYEICLHTLNYIVQRHVFNNLQYFLAGMLAAYAHVHIAPRRYFTQKQWNGMTLAVLLFTLVNLLFYRIALSPADMQILLMTHRPPVEYCGALVTVCLTTLALLLLAPHATGRVAWVFTNRFIRFCGTISYSLYLMHPFIFAVCLFYIRARPFKLFVASMLLAFLVGTLMHWVIERPCNALGKKISRIISA